MSAPITATAEEQLNDLRAGRPWREAFEIACEVEYGERREGWDDASLITVYKECLVRGLTHQASPEAFLEACKRLSRLLFRYGRAREANNFLLLLRDLSPDPERIPAWAWSYSAKLAYLEDIDYCTSKPETVLGYIRKALLADSSNAQATAVLADFINTASRHLAERSAPEAATRLSSILQEFLASFSIPSSESIEHALKALNSLHDFDSAVQPATVPTPALVPRPHVHDREDEIRALRAELAEATARADALTEKSEALRRRNEALLLELHLLRDEVKQESTSFAQFSALIERLETQLEHLMAEVARERGAEARQPEPPQPIPDHEPAPVLAARARILVIGQSRVPEQHLLGICKAMELERDQTEFRLSYDAFDSLDIRSLQYNESVAGILIGPVPHKVPGQDDPVQALMRQEGYPPAVRVETNSGELKITKSSFRDALQSLLTRIASLEPSIH